MNSIRPYPLGEPYRLELDPAYQDLLGGDELTRVRLPFGGTSWLAVRYDHVREALASPTLSRTLAAGNPDLPRQMPEPPPPGAIMALDGEEHTRLRRLVGKAFTARRIEGMRDEIQRLVDELIDTMAATGSPADLVSHVAVPLPLRVICNLLGVPVEDQEHFRSFTEKVMGTTAFGSEEVQTAMAEFFGYLAKLVAERRASPTDDLLSALVLARDEDDRLSEQELVWLGVALLIGGHETTLNQIANFTYVLLNHPEQLAEFRAHPEIAPRAIEELLRFVPTGAGSAHATIATEDMVLGGVTVHKGEGVVVDLAAANYDPRVFRDPQRLDLRREPNHHLALGHSAHFCLGAQLARVELQLVFTTLLRRFPDLRLAVPADELEWNTGGLIRGLKRLPVAW
jgi:cytochrome P450